MVVGWARLVLALGQSRSLKDKRQIVRKVVDRVRARFLVAIAEVEDHDLWQKSTLGLAAVGGDAAHVRAMLDEVVRSIEEMYLAPVVACDVQVETMGDFSDPETARLRAAARPGESGGPGAWEREMLAGTEADEASEPAVARPGAGRWGVDPARFQRRLDEDAPPAGGAAAGETDEYPGGAEAVPSGQGFDEDGVPEGFGTQNLVSGAREGVPDAEFERGARPPGTDRGGRRRR